MRDIKLKELESNILEGTPIELSSKSILFKPIMALLMFPFLIVFFSSDIDLPQRIMIYMIVSISIATAISILMLIYSTKVVLIGEIVSLKTLFGPKIEYNIYQIAKTKVLRLRGRSFTMLTVEDTDGSFFRRIVLNSDRLFKREVPTGDVIDFAKSILSKDKEA